jgi:hypothetical protein
MGAKGRLYDSDDILRNQSSMTYNDESTNVWASDFTSITGDSSTYYYSCGLTAAFNGNGYTKYSTYQTVNILGY